MANVVITSTTEAIKVVFNDESTKANGMTHGTWSKHGIQEVHYYPEYIEVITAHGVRWSLRNTANGPQTMIVDSVDGLAPSSLSDLYSKISALIE